MPAASGRRRLLVHSYRLHLGKFYMETSPQLGATPSERLVDAGVFFAELRAAGRGVLLLDYDGTLAPLTPDRDHAFPYDGVRERLERLARSSRLVIVSGRPVTDVLRLLAPASPLEVWGVHGLERCLPTGEYLAVALPAEDAELLQRAATEMEAHGWMQHLERKPGSIALHWRGLPASEVQTMRAETDRLWLPLTRSGRLTLQPFDGGFELRAAARTKGYAVRAILTETPSQTPVAYLGDDLTDEDAFRALTGRGLRVLVRHEFRRTLADLWLRPPEQLLAFLDRWEQALGGRP